MPGRFRVDVKTELPQLAHFLNQSVKKQLPFATAKALTKTAQGAAKKQRGEMSGRFTIRNKRVIRGITINRAEKRDWPRVRAEVGSRDDFMELQETGGVKRPRSGSNLAIPSRAIRRTRTGKVRKGQKPKAVMARKGSEATSKHILRKGTKRNHLRIMYKLQPVAKIRPRLGLRRTVTEYARRHHGRLFDRELTAALNSQKRKSKATIRAK